jgi:hypothetical protein
MRFIDAEWRAGHVLSRDEKLLRWQFDPRLLPGRDLSGPSVMLAWQGETIVGMFGLTASGMTLEGTPASAVWLSHWFASPQYRHNNVAYGLLCAVLELGLDVVATNGANSNSTKLLSALHFEAIPALPRWIGVVNVSQTARLLVDCNDGLGVKEAERICEGHRAEIPADPTTAAAEAQVRPWRDEYATAWDAYWKEQVAPSIVGTTRDAQFLRWRYARHPRLRYQIRLVTGQGDRVVGLAVYRLERIRGRKETVMRVVEFLTTPPTQAVLARTILQAAHHHRVAYADFYCSSASAARGLEEMGFKLETVAQDQPAFPTRLQPLEKGSFAMTALMRLPPARRGQLAALVRTGRLYLTKSDGDQDRPN